MKKSISFVLLLSMLLSVIAPLSGVITFAEETNIALGKTVTGPGTNAASVTDGKRDVASFWDGGVAPAEAVIDLGAYYDITKVNVVTYHGDGRYYHYTVSTSDNGLVFDEVGKKDDNSVASEEGVDHTFEKTARYVKITLTKNSANPSVHLCEVSVYGSVNEDYEPEPIRGEDPNDPANIAYYKPVRSNSVSSIPQAANDGNTTTVWKAEYYPMYVDIDLLDNYDISKIVLFMPIANRFAFDIYGSLDGVNYTSIVSSEGMQKCTNKGFTFELKDTCYRIIRINVTANSAGSGSNGAQIADVKIYGTKNDSPVTPTRKTISFTSYEEWLKKNHNVDLSKITDKNGRYDIDATYTEADTVKEIQGIVTRMLGEKYVSWFVFDVDANGNGSKDKDYFKISDDNGKIKISGTDGTCIAAGLNWYLKYYCNVHISQQTAQVKMPDKVVKVGSDVLYETEMKVRYAYNYCTLSYTMPFFGYDDWRRELDWLMLNGVNLVLDITATEALWVHYLQQLGYTVDQAKDYVCGYSFKAWWLMGNLENYGGSVSDQWVYDTLEMARVNQRSLTVMGAEPALQTFVGAMPSTFGTLAKSHLIKKGYDDVSKYMAAQGGWSGFTRPNVLRTDYDGYSYLAQMFYDSQDYLYGQVTDYYCGDVCHEGGIIPDGLAKEDMAEKILNECLEADEDAIWMLQVWWDNPMKGVLDGFGDKKDDHVILLDLAAANSPKYTNATTWGSKEYGGTSWIFCTLDNYGGRAGMHGKLTHMCDLIVKAKNDAKYMKGIGITPEGTQNNPIMMDLFWEMVWRDETPKINDWTHDYIIRRYGADNSEAKIAWTGLLMSVYLYGSYDGTTINYSISSHPKFSGYDTGYYKANYNNSALYNSITHMAKAYDELKDNECYIYDFVDMLRTYLSNQCTDYLSELKTVTGNYRKEDRLERYQTLYKKYLDGMLLVDELSAYSKDELLGTWIGRAEKWVNDERTGEYDDYTKDMMEFNAKCLISAWSSVSLIDYANRQYNGLVSDYYYVAWKDFFESNENAVKAGNNVASKSLPGGEYFGYAWSFIINDVDYSDKKLDPDGGVNGRGIMAIFEKIVANHGKDAKKTPFVEITLASKDVEFVVKSGVISGITDGTDAETLISSLSYPKGTTISIIGADGKEVNGVVKSGDKVVLKDADGAVVDTLVIGDVKIVSQEDKDKAEQYKKEIIEIYNYLNDMNKEGFDDMLLKRINAAMKNCKDVVEGTVSVGLSSLESYLTAIRNAKNQADIKYNELHPPVTETPTPQEGDNGNIVTVIIIVAVSVVAVGGIAVAVVLVIKKKKK